MTRHRATLLGIALAAGVTSACHNAPRKQDEELAKSTFACQLAEERVLVRMERDEVRLVMANGEHINLYLVPSASTAGARYTNGTTDAVGKGLELTIMREGAAPEPLRNCGPLVPPKS